MTLPFFGSGELKLMRGDESFYKYCFLWSNDIRLTVPTEILASDH